MPDFKINVVVDPTRAKSGAEEVNKALGRTTGQADRLRNTLARTFATLGLSVGIASAVRSLATFSEEMARVRAVSEATEEQFADLREEAKRLGLETKFSATEAASGMFELAQAGFSVSQILTSTNDVLVLAQAGGLGIAQAADIAASALNGFRLSADQAARVSDVLAVAANKSNSGVADLGEGLKFAAPTAAGLNVSLEETVAALGVLSDSALKGSLAGTGLKTVLSELEAPSATTAALLNSLGVTIREVTPSQVGLTRALERLKEAGVDTGLAFQLFGQRGGPAFEVLATGTTKLKSLTAALQDSKGEAQRVADVMNTNLGFSLKSVASSFVGLTIALGDLGAESSLNRFLKATGDGLKFLAKNADAVGRALGAAGLTFVVFELVKAFNALRLAILKNPFGALVVALTAVVSLVAAFSDEILVSEDGITTLADVGVAAFDEIKVAIVPVIDLVKEFFAKILGIEGPASFKDLVLGGARAFDALVGVARGTFNVLRSLFGDETTKLGAIFDLLFGSVVKQGELAFKRLANTITNVFTDPIGALARSFSDLLGALSGAVAVAKNLGIVSEETRSNFEDSITKLEILARRRAGPENPNLPFKTADLDKEQAALDKFVKESTEKIAAARAESITDIAARLGEAFREGFTADTIVPFVTRVFDEAEKAARERLLNTAAPKPGEEGFIGPLLPEEPAPGGGPADALVEQAQAQATARAEINKTLQALDAEAQVLETSISLRGVAVDALKAELDLRERGVVIGEEERQQILERVEVNRLLARRAEIIDQLRGAEENLRLTQQALDGQVAAGTLTQDEYNRILGEAKIAALEFDQSLEGGLSRGIEKVNQQLHDIASLAENVVVGAFNSTADAIAELAATGATDFRRLAQSILSDISRLITRLLILKLVESSINLLGGGTGAVGGALGGGEEFHRQEGGPVQANRPFLVGEDGPELFLPRNNGEVLSNAQTRAFAGSAAGGSTIVQTPPPVVNVSVVNLTQDDEALAAALATPSGERAVLNVIRRNKRSVRSDLAQ